MSAYEVYDKDRQGMVLRIERSSVHDGPGLRTVVFLKGCSLRCQWCSTPESQSFQIEKTKDNIYGSLMTVEEVMREVRKDSLFFFISTGGITISGGELLAQPEFSLALLKNCRKECFHTAVETTFYAPWETIKPLLPYINLVFVDIKFFSSDLHKQYCGADNRLILDNLLATNSSKEWFQLVVRVPIIPGINNSEEELSKIGKFCSQLTKLSYIQLLSYHKLGTATYPKLGRTCLLPDVVPPTVDEMERCKLIVQQFVENTIF